MARNPRKPARAVKKNSKARTKMVKVKTALLPSEMASTPTAHVRITSPSQDTEWTAGSDSHFHVTALYSGLPTSANVLRSRYVKSDGTVVQADNNTQTTSATGSGVVVFNFTNGPGVAGNHVIILEATGSPSASDDIIVFTT